MKIPLAAVFLFIAGPVSAASPSSLYINNNVGITNGVQITGAATGSSPTIGATGSDSNIGLILDTEGSGVVSIGTNAAGSELNVNGGASIGTGYVGAAASSNGAIIQGGVGIGTTIVGLYQLNVQQEGSNEAYFASTGPNASVVYIDDAAGGNPSQVDFLDGGVGRWYVGKNNSLNTNNFFVYDAYGNQNYLVAQSGGAMVIGPAQSMVLFQNGNVTIGGTLSVGSFASGTSTTVCRNGNILASCSSASALKENIAPSTFGLAEILEMKPVTFDFRDHIDNWEKHDFGFIAEDMEKVSPLFVTYDKDGAISGVRYMQLTAVTAKAIQQLNDLVKTQDNELAKQAELLLNQQRQIDELRIEVNSLTHRE